MGGDRAQLFQQLQHDGVGHVAMVRSVHHDSVYISLVFHPEVSIGYGRMPVAALVAHEYWIIAIIGGSERPFPPVLEEFRRMIATIGFILI